MIKDIEKSTVQSGNDFNFWYPANLTKSGDGKFYVEGIASTDDVDAQGERLVQKGIDLSYYLRSGWLNWDHGKDPADRVGCPLEARVTKDGLWTRGYLLDTKKASEIVELASALKKAGGDRKLGFSVQGKVLKRDPNDNKIIRSCWISEIAITPNPINPHTFLELSKSFSNPDATQVFVDAATEEEALVKAKAEKEKSNPDLDELDALREATKTPVVEQSKEEEKDAEKTTQEALSDKHPKPELEKELNDVPVAKRAGTSVKSTAKSLVKLEIDAEGNVVIKGLKLPDNDPGIVPQECEHCGKLSCQGHTELHGVKENKTAAKVQAHADTKDEKEGKLDKHPDEVKDKETSSKVKKAEDSYIGQKCAMCDEFPSTHKYGNEPICARCKKDFAEPEIAAGGKKTLTEFKRPADYEKSERNTDVEKGFSVISSLGGIQEQGSKKVPVHTITYGHKSGHHMQVSGKEGNFVVVHSHKNGKEAENLGCVFFVDDPAKGKNGKKDVDEYLKGFGIRHKFADKDKLMGKSFEFAQGDEKCSICQSQIAAGKGLIKSGDKCFCDDTCIEKAMIAGYSFGVTDQANGGAMRVESLEGSQKDTSYGSSMLTKVKEVKFDNARANGGAQSVSLSDALDFLTQRGLPMPVADRLLVLMIKNDGDLTGLTKKAKKGKKAS